MLVLWASLDVKVAGVPGEGVQLWKLLLTDGHLCKLTALGHHGQQLQHEQNKGWVVRESWMKRGGGGGGGGGGGEQEEEEFSKKKKMSSEMWSSPAVSPFQQLLHFPRAQLLEFASGSINTNCNEHHHLSKDRVYCQLSQGQTLNMRLLALDQVQCSSK